MLRPLVVLAVAVGLAAPATAPDRVEAGRLTPARPKAGAPARARHLARKIREAPRPDRTLALAAALRVTALATGRVRPAHVPLGALREIHGIHGEAIERKIARRAAALAPAVPGGLRRGVLDAATQDRLVPSKGRIRVVRHRGRFVVLDGNSRLQAMRRAFAGRPGLAIEVELIDTRSPAVTRLLDRLLARRGLAH